MNTPTEQQPRSLEEAEAIVDIFESLEKLESNPDFKKVFEKHLFTDEVIRLHSLLAHPEKSIVDSRDRILSDLDALSNVKFALLMIRSIGKSVKTQLEEFRAAEFEESLEAAGEEL
ncbi:MAG: hypothetical protein DRQ78_12145 [Epsilonproteobacteria bacterium]|nr:MAG: hypothetical protein DRQ78_12145 [Campylobacterota bacterium]